MRFLKSQHAPNSKFSWAVPRTPLRKLTALPKPSNWWGGGLMPPPKNPFPAVCPSGLEHLTLGIPTFYSMVPPMQGSLHIIMSLWYTVPVNLSCLPLCIFKICYQWLLWISVIVCIFVFVKGYGNVFSAFSYAYASIISEVVTSLHANMFITALWMQHVILCYSSVQ